MSSETDNLLSAASPSGSAEAAGPAALPASGEAADPERGEAEHDSRLHRLKLQLDAIVNVRSLRVGDLLSLKRGGIVETVHEHAEDVPLRCGGVLLMWAEFEVVEQKLAVRITRLA